MMTTFYVVEEWNGRRWAKVRGPEGGPWSNRSRAEAVARARQEAAQRLSSTEGWPHRVAHRSFAAVTAKSAMTAKSANE